MTTAPETVFPGTAWEHRSPEDVGFSIEKLDQVRRQLADDAGGKPYRVAIVRHGYLIAEWEQGVDRERKFGLASAAKSMFSSILGVAIAEGKIPSADAKVIDYYPEMMEVGENEGPKPGRFAREKDRDITFRQLICNTSGYFKPDEMPGKVFHYQTFGMNILTNAIATAYGLYDSSHPGQLPGCGALIEEKLRNPIGGTWDYSYTNFKLPPQAKINIFGNYTQLAANARDMARMGLLWLRWGDWNGRQVIPETWLKGATAIAPDILENEPESNWKYGHGFWTNDHGLMWPSLPRDSYAASGAGAKHIWVCPSLDIVVAQSPGIWDQFRAEAEQVNAQDKLLASIINACRC